MSVVVFGLSAGFFGNAGYIICLIFCSPVLVSGVFLIEPILAQCFGWALGVDKAPGWLTWAGTCLVLFGIHQVHRADAIKNNKKSTQTSTVEIVEHKLTKRSETIEDCPA